MAIWKSDRKQLKQAIQKKRLRLEQLEERRLLAIMWANEFGAGADDPEFNDVYGPDETLARAIVNRAIDDWNSVVLDQDFDNDSNPNTNDFQLKIFASDLGGGTRGSASITNFTHGGSGQSGWNIGVPTAATISLDDNGGGFDWFFDQTPLDDAEFTAVVNSGSNGTGPAFQASFIDIAGGHVDFYRTVVHEIGHALGITGNSNAAIAGMLTPLYLDSSHQQPVIDPTGLSVIHLSRFESTLSSPQFGISATFIGGHIYEGDVYGANNDPSNVYEQGSSAPLTFDTHPNELLNTGRITPVGNPGETTRQFISDLDAMILADAYDYTVNLPSNINSAHVSLDSLTGTLLVQGGVNSAGDPRNESFSITEVGNSIQVQVTVGSNVTTELFLRAAVSQLIIAPNGGTDSISVASSLNNIPGFRKDVHYVVSSNEDRTDDNTGDGVVDQDVAVPGRQVSLRNAIRDGRITSGSNTSIYVPRGHYNLTLTGTGDSDAYGDLHIDENVIIIGSGAGATIIDASQLETRDRVFEIKGSSSLDLTRVTLTGGETSDRGGAIRVNNNTNGAVTELTLREVVIVGNTATNSASTGFGGGVYVAPDAQAFIFRSVITDNTAGANGGGGGIFASGSSNGIAMVTLEKSVIANNASGSSSSPDLRSAGTPLGNFFSNGGNLITSTNGATFGTPGLQGSDYYDQPVDYVVTSFVDSFDHTDDAYALSIREAIDLANDASGTDEIWLPAWSFMLIRDRETFGEGSDTDTEVGFGDLDIHQSLVIRGSGSSNATSVAWKPGVVDRVFELLGDYGSNDMVDITDWMIWRDTLHSTTTLAADGDDDGVVDDDDYDIWGAHFGNTLDLLNVTVV